MEKLVFTCLLYISMLGWHSSRQIDNHLPVNVSSKSTFIKQVPVLCYHQIRDWKATDSKSAKTYITPIKRFSEHIKMLRDSGYHTISPDQLTAYLLHHQPLPEKPILLTFDDGTASQYTNALPELDKYGFNATFFIMTVTINQPDYLNRKQLAEISALGHSIGCHTWDHHDVRNYKDQDWATQLTKPTKLLQEITGKPVLYFSYPYGAWNAQAIGHLKNHGYSSAFQLSGKQDTAEPMYTIRRIIVDGHWTANQLNHTIKEQF